MNDVATLATALYARTDDMLKEHPDLAPWRPPVGITPRLTGSGRYSGCRPGRAGARPCGSYNKRLARPPV
jgi:hypothetical protein